MTRKPELTPARKGQTLVEFALTLPLLLLLIFGIIEFGRLFQSWVMIQNAARAAARYASVGAINYEIFVDPDPDSTVPLDIRILDAIVPCVGSDDPGGEDQRGDPAQLNGVNILTGGVESLFATWYDGTNCDPGNEDHQQYRKDILRLVSIMNEAHSSMSSLGTEPSRFRGLDADGVRNLLYGTWSKPRGGPYNQMGYVDVHICSSRPFIDPASTGYSGGFVPTRFITIRNQTDLALLNPNVNFGEPEDYPIPYCMLNEIPPQTNFDGSPRDRVLTNVGKRWLDAGGAGDRVNISLTFNHPLITPISNEPFLTMDARRSTVNESFRAPKAVGAFQRSLPPGSDPEADARPTLEPTDTHTPTDPPPPTDTPPPTNTPTPEPFDCALISASWANNPFVGTEFYMRFRNDNKLSTELVGVALSWGDATRPPVPTFPGMYMLAGALNNEVHWVGGAPSIPPSQYEVNFVKNGPGWQAGAFTFVGGQSTSIWSGVFQNGPQQLAEYMNLWDFDGTFQFVNPDDGSICNISFNRPEAPLPTETPIPTEGPSPTPTPDCASARDLTMRWGGWDTFVGTAYFEIINNTGVPATIVGVDLVWPDARHPQISWPQTEKYRMSQVVLGEAPGAPGSVVLWQGAAGQDNSGNTRTDMPFDRATRAGRFGGVNVGNPAEGNWVSNGIVPPNSMVRLHLNFEGPGTNDMRVWGLRPHHFHFPLVSIDCTPRGGSGGGGGGSEDDGLISVPLPSPTNTNTPAPTATRGPTNTPSNTSPPPTATRTFTPAPTQVPSNTPVATLTPSNTPLGVIIPPTNRP